MLTIVLFYYQNDLKNKWIMGYLQSCYFFMFLLHYGTVADSQWAINIANM